MGQVGASGYFSDVGFTSFGEFFSIFFRVVLVIWYTCPAKISPTHYGTARGEIGVLKGRDGAGKSLQRAAGVEMEGGEIYFLRP